MFFGGFFGPKKPLLRDGERGKTEGKKWKFKLGEQHKPKISLGKIPFTGIVSFYRFNY